MSASGFAAILARLQAAQLRLHCDEALRLELVQLQHQLHDVSAAMQRLRDVGKAARSLVVGHEIAPTASQSAALLALEREQKELGRAVSQFGLERGPPQEAPPASVCCKCQASGCEEEPLLSKPDAAALSPPRRPRPAAAGKLKAEPRRKLVVRRKSSPAAATAAATAVAQPRLVEEEEEEAKADHPEAVVVDDDSEEEEEAGDVRARLSQRVDACWPLATSLGALEMPQRRSADYADLVKRVCAVFKTLYECDASDVASRGMRSVIVKAKDSLAVAVSLLILHDVTDANAPVILALLKAVDAASGKHTPLQKHVAPFRDSLAELEVLLLTRSYGAQQADHGGASSAKKKRSSW